MNQPLRSIQQPYLHLLTQMEQKNQQQSLRVSVFQPTDNTTNRTDEFDETKSKKQVAQMDKPRKEFNNYDYSFDGLSLAQLNAVNTPSPVVVLAAAGTGKTTTIIHRIAKANIVDLLSLDAVFMTTFSRKAATEMTTRLSKLINGIPKYAGTFHRNTIHLIKEYPILLTSHGYDSDFELIDATDMDHLLAEALKPHMEYLKSQGINLKMAKKWMREGIDALKSQGKYPIDLHCATASVFEYNILSTTKKFQDIPANVAYKSYLAYQTELKSMGMLDFNDVMALPTFAMRDNSIRSRVNKNFKLVIVDEFQDCSALQFEIVEYLSHDGKYLYLVGDEDQLIYGWRDADLSKVMEAYTNPNIKQCFLEDNYRSDANIVNLATAIITQNTMRSEKVMRAIKPAQCDVSNVMPYDTKQEAELIVKRIKMLIDNGVKPNEIAIIARSNDYPTITEVELLKHKIDYNFVKAYNFFEYKEVKDVVAYLMLALNHKHNLAFRRVFNYPKRKNGKAALNKVEALAYHNGGSSLFEAVMIQKDITSTNKKFVKIVVTLSQMMQNGKTVKQVMKYLIDSLDIEYVLHVEHGILEGDIRFERIKKLSMVIDIMMEEYGDYQETLSALNDEMVSIKKETNENKVQIMTIHGSKGLEFEHVFLIGAVNGMMPSIHGEPQTIDKHQIFKNTNIEEERRLFYVAVTRAKVSLIISSPKYVYRYGSVSEYERTMFLDGLEDMYIVK